MACNVFSWGSVEDGRLGVGQEREKQLFPRPVWGLMKESGVTACAAGWRHSLFLSGKNEVFACGSGAKGESCGAKVPPEATSWPKGKVGAVRSKKFKDASVQRGSWVPVNVEAAAVAAGDGFSLATSRDGEVYAWGKGAYGVLGVDDERDQASPVLSGLEPSFRARKVACGRWHVLVLSRSGKVYSFGRNHLGQLGLGFKSSAEAKPSLVSFDDDFIKVVDISAGGAHSVAIADTLEKNKRRKSHQRSPSLKTESPRVAYAWGDGSCVGAARDSDVLSPWEVKPLSLFLARKKLGGLATDKKKIVSCGGSHTLVRTKYGQLVAWGAGTYGQLGYGDVWHRPDCALVSHLNGVFAFDAGHRHGVAIAGLEDLGGKVYTWGWNHFGELGLGDCDTRLQPTLVRGLEHAAAVDCAAGHRHSIVLTKLAITPHDAPCDKSTIDAPQHLSAKRAAFLKAQLASAALDSPGATNSVCAPIPRVDPDTRYCLDTLATKDGRATFETVSTCLPCKVSRVCRACARHCHNRHFLQVNFIPWTPKKDQCGCLLSGKCQASWSPERAIFDTIADETAADAISLQDLRRLLEALHPNDINDEDLDAADVALRSPSGTLTWLQFNRWHAPYFKDRRNNDDDDDNSQVVDENSEDIE